ncbi:uncharacterized protein PAN0_003d1558 [Moesziomyces antarcticus]|uniref:uncharacterized protein n=1 Tax=Pseudozyma antarctica TaxID=84753 RepID=UPI0007197C7A|nr:uncharacterized protein PAN0_003d1558 [Moesziomyces antarcticus]GAK63354.1 hypothetical protein PAN0_003d1558 [Moesziomyces antarcticus]
MTARYETEAHCEQHVAMLLAGHAETQWTQHDCRFCLVDASLSVSVRGHLFKEPDRLRRHVCSNHIYPDRHPQRSCPYCRASMAAYNLIDHLREQHDLALGSTLAQRQHDQVGCGSNSGGRAEWIDWIPSITPSTPAGQQQPQPVGEAQVAPHLPAASARPTRALPRPCPPAWKRQLVAAAAAATSLDARAMTFTAAQDNTSSPRPSCTRSSSWKPCLLPHPARRSIARMGGAMRLRTYRKKTSPARTLVCPFCAADEQASSTDRTKVWRPAKIGRLIVMIHLFSQTSSGFSCCPVCSQSMRIDRLALHLDQQHDLTLASKSSEPLSEDLCNLQKFCLFQEWIAQGCRAKPRHVPHCPEEAVKRRQEAQPLVICVHRCAGSQQQPAFKSG